MFVSQHRVKQPSFPKVKPHAPNTLHTPLRSGLSFIGRLKQSLWILGARLKDRDVKHAFKAGMGMAILAAPAFFDTTRPVFMDYRGEWALISVCQATVCIYYRILIHHSPVFPRHLSHYWCSKHSHVLIHRRPLKYLSDKFPQLSPRPWHAVSGQNAPSVVFILNPL